MASNSNNNSNNNNSNHLNVISNPSLLPDGGWVTRLHGDDDLTDGGASTKDNDTTTNNNHSSSNHAAMLRKDVKKQSATERFLMWLMMENVLFFKTRWLHLLLLATVLLQTLSLGLDPALFPTGSLPRSLFSGLFHVASFLPERVTEGQGQEATLYVLLFVALLVAQILVCRHRYRKQASRFASSGAGHLNKLKMMKPALVTSLPYKFRTQKQQEHQRYRQHIRLMEAQHQLDANIDALGSTEKRDDDTPPMDRACIPARGDLLVSVVHLQLNVASTVALPFLLLLLLKPLHCDFSNLSHLSMLDSTPRACDQVFNLVLGGVGALCFLALSSLVAVTTLFSVPFLPGCTLSTSGFLSGRLLLGINILRMLLAISHSVLVHSTPVAHSIISGGGAMILFLLCLRWFPFFNKGANFSLAAFLGAMGGSCLATIGASTRPSSGLTLGLVFGVAVLGALLGMTLSWVRICRANQRRTRFLQLSDPEHHKKQSQRTEFRGLRIPDDQDEDDDEGPFGDSPLAVELMARMLTLFGRDGDPNTGPDPFLASIIFRVGEDCFPNNHLLRLYGLVYEWTFRACVSEPIPTELLETVSELLIESAASLPVDARFILFSFSQQYKTDDMRQQELALRLQVVAQEFISCKSVLFSLWKHLAGDLVDKQKVTAFVLTFGSLERSCDILFRDLLTEFPDSAAAVELWAQYNREVKNDSLTSSRIFDVADALEENTRNEAEIMMDYHARTINIIEKSEEITNLLHFLDKSSEGDEEDGVRNPFSRGPDDIGSITGSQNSRRHLLDHADSIGYAIPGSTQEEDLPPSPMDPFLQTQNYGRTMIQGPPSLSAHNSTYSYREDHLPENGPVHLPSYSLDNTDLLADAASMNNGSTVEGRSLTSAADFFPTKMRMHRPSSLLSEEFTPFDSRAIQRSRLTSSLQIQEGNLNGGEYLSNPVVNVDVQQQQQHGVSQTRTTTLDALEEEASERRSQSSGGSGSGAHTLDSRASTAMRTVIEKEKPWQVSAAGVAFGFLLVLCIACIVISFALSNQAMENYLTEVILLEDLGIIIDESIVVGTKVSTSYGASVNASMPTSEKEAFLRSARQYGMGNYSDFFSILPKFVSLDRSRISSWASAFSADLFVPSVRAGASSTFQSPRATVLDAFVRSVEDSLGFNHQTDALMSAGGLFARDPYYVLKQVVETLPEEMDKLQDTAISSLLSSLDGSVVEQWIRFGIIVGAFLFLALLVYIFSIRVLHTQFTTGVNLFRKIGHINCLGVYLRMKELFLQSMQAGESEMLSNGQVQHGLRPGTACAPSFLYILKSAHFRFATLVMLAIITCFAFSFLTVQLSQDTVFVGKIISPMNKRNEYLDSMSIAAHQLSISSPLFSTDFLLSDLEKFAVKARTEHTVVSENIFRTGWNSAADKEQEELFLSPRCSGSPPSSSLDNDLHCASYNILILRVADVGQNLKSLWNSLSTDERQAQLLFIHNAVNSMGSFFGKSTEILDREYEDRQALFHLILNVVLGFSLALLVLLFLVVFVPSARRIFKDLMNLKHVLLFLPVEFIEANYDVQGYLLSGSMLTTMQMSQTLNEQREKFKSFFQSTDKAMVMTNDKLIVELTNKAFVEIFGYSAQEIVGENIKVIIGDPVLRARHDEIVSNFLEQSKAQRSSRLKNRTLRSVARHRSDRLIQVAVTVTEIFVGDRVYFSAFIEDLTADQEMHRALKTAQEKLRKVLDASLNGFVLVDENAIIKECNVRTRQMFGYQSEADLLGQNVKILVPPPHSASHDRYVASFFHDGNEAMVKDGREVPGRRKDGSTFVLRIFLHRFEHAGSSMVACFTQDVSQEKHRMEALGQKNEDIKSLMKTAVDAIFWVDKSGFIEHFSASASIIFGYSARELLGRHSVGGPSAVSGGPSASGGGGDAEDDSLEDVTLEDLLQPASTVVRIKWNDLVTDYLGVESKDVMLWRKNGTTFWANVSMREVSRRNLKFFVCRVSDITSRTQSLRQNASRAQEMTKLLDSYIPNKLLKKLLARSRTAHMARMKKSGGVTGGADASVPDGEENVVGVDAAGGASASGSASGALKAAPLVDFHKDVTCIFIKFPDLVQNAAKRLAMSRQGSVADQLLQQMGSPSEGDAESEKSAQALAEEENVKDVLALLPVLNDLFVMLDQSCAAHHLERVKSMSYSYLAVCGMYHQRADHADAAMSFAWDVREKILAYNKKRPFKVNFRIGINTGSLTAGIVGDVIQTFDIYGDCVNVASRMESSCPLNGVQVSSNTKAQLTGKYTMEESAVEVKGIGIMATFIVHSRVR